MSEPLSLPFEEPAESGVGIRLENFEGPLDLLLYLIRKNDLEISDIPIAEITQEYLAYLDLMKDLNLETAGDFLVMASTLMQIKAQMLLPAPETDEETGPDPRAELMSKLLEYQQFKEASSILQGWNERSKDIFYRPAAPAFTDEDFSLKASAFDLLAAFKRVLERTPRETREIIRDEVSLEIRIGEVLELVSLRGRVTFEDLFTDQRRRIDLIITFMAILELIRLKQIIATQAEIFGPIEIGRAEPDAQPAEPAASAEPPAQPSAPPDQEATA